MSNDVKSHWRFFFTCHKVCFTQQMHTWDLWRTVVMALSLRCYSPWNYPQDGHSALVSELWSPFELSEMLQNDLISPNWPKRTFDEIFQDFCDPKVLTPLPLIAPRRVIWDEDPGFLRFVVIREEVADKAWLAAATAASSEELPEECFWRHMKKLQQSSEITTCQHVTPFSDTTWWLCWFCFSSSEIRERENYIFIISSLMFIEGGHSWHLSKGLVELQESTSRFWFGGLWSHQSLQWRDEGLGF